MSEPLLGACWTAGGMWWGDLVPPLGQSSQARAGEWRCGLATAGSADSGPTCSDPRRLARRQRASSARHPSVGPDLFYLRFCGRRGHTEKEAAPCLVAALDPQPARVARSLCGSLAPHFLPCRAMLNTSFPTTCFAKVFTSALTLVGAPFYPWPNLRDRWGHFWSF